MRGRARQLIDLVTLESVTNDLLLLKDLLDLTDDQKKEESARHGSHHLRDWIDRNDVDVSEEVISAIEDGEPWEAVEALTPDQLKEFGEWVGPKMSEEGIAPPHVLMDYRGMIRNGWLIHFSDNADDICHEGFTSGIPLTGEYMLGLTTAWKDSAKTGGYNFAFRVEDFDRYGRDRQGWKYGKHAVVFQASGVLVYHWGDEEPQVIFIGDTAQNIVHVYETDDGWCVGPDEERPVFRSDDLKDVVNWIVKNFNQYKRVIACR